MQANEPPRDKTRGTDREQHADARATRPQTDSGTPPRKRDDAEFRATFRNGSGFRTIFLREVHGDNGNLVAEDVTGRQHIWSAGSDVHIVDLGVDSETHTDDSEVFNR